MIGGEDKQSGIAHGLDQQPARLVDGKPRTVEQGRRQFEQLLGAAPDAPFGVSLKIKKSDDDDGVLVPC